MKIFVCLFALLAYANASALLAAPVLAAPAHLSTGSSTQSRTQDAAGNYAFAYNEQHGTGGSSRSESGTPLGTVGSYSLNVGDVRQRVVKYVADGLGFRASISTNEPGTEAKAPASVAINAPAAVVAAPVAVAAAPVAAYAAAPAYAAPAYPAPAYAAPVAIAPAVSGYSSSINHAAPAVFAAPAKVLAAPAAYAAPAW